MDFAYVNREMCRWARERRQFTQAHVAARIGVTVAQIAQWETGNGLPSFGKAQLLAKELEIPLGFLFLSAPPTEILPIPDLRQIKPSGSTRSPEFIDLVNDVTVKQDWFADYAAKSGARHLSFVGKGSVNDSPFRVAESIRSVIGTNEARKEARSWSDYLRLLTQRAEDAGVLVMRSGVVRGNPHRALSVSEFRGLAINHSIAPLVFINSRDAVAAQVFTLAHELVHIWIGQSGISNPDLTSRAQKKASPSVTEEFCNETAAELLVPAAEFHVAWGAPAHAGMARVEHLAVRFRVSVPVILRRANELGHISSTTFFNLFGEHQRKVAEIEKRKEEEEEEASGGNFYNTFFARNSRRLSQAVVTVVRTGRMSRLEAARLLGVRSATIPKLYERLPL